MHLPVRLANHPCLDAVGRAVWRCRGEHDRQTSNTWSGKQDRPFEGALRSQTPQIWSSTRTPRGWEQRCADGPRRLSMRADSASCNEDHDDHHPSPPELPPCLGHGVFLSGPRGGGKTQRKT
jgi:hypothetical protein